MRPACIAALYYHACCILLVPRDRSYSRALEVVPLHRMHDRTVKTLRPLSIRCRRVRSGGGTAATRATHGRLQRLTTRSHARRGAHVVGARTLVRRSAQSPLRKVAGFRYGVRLRRARSLGGAASAGLRVCRGWNCGRLMAIQSHRLRWIRSNVRAYASGASGDEARP